MKVLFWLAAVIVAVFFGAKWLQQHPHAADIQKTTPGVYQPQPPNQPGKKFVVVP